MSDSWFAHTVPNLAGAAMLLLGLLLPTRQRRGAAARVAAWQGGLLALAAASTARGGEAGPLLWLLAFGALAGRALLLPALLRLPTERAGGDAFPRADDHAASRTGGDGPPHGGNATPTAPSATVSLLAGGGLAVLAVAAVMPAGAGMASGMREGLALALAVLLAGLLTMLLRRGVLFGLLGLLAAENGALLGLVHAGGAMPGAAALAVLSPGLVACVLLAARSGRGVSVQSLLWGSGR